MLIWVLRGVLVAKVVWAAVTAGTIVAIQHEFCDAVSEKENIRSLVGHCNCQGYEKMNIKIKIATCLKQRDKKIWETGLLCRAQRSRPSRNEPLRKVADKKRGEKCARHSAQLRLIVPTDTRFGEISNNSFLWEANQEIGDLGEFHSPPCPLVRLVQETESTLMAWGKAFNGGPPEIPVLRSEVPLFLFTLSIWSATVGKIVY